MKLTAPELQFVQNNVAPLNLLKDQQDSPTKFVLAVLDVAFSWVLM